MLISNVASICIDEPDLPLLASLVPIFLITALEILNSTLLWFSPAYAELLLGTPLPSIVATCGVMRSRSVDASFELQALE